MLLIEKLTKSKLGKSQDYLIIQGFEYKDKKLIDKFFKIKFNNK